MPLKTRGRRAAVVPPDRVSAGITGPPGTAAPGRPRGLRRRRPEPGEEVPEERLARRGQDRLGMELHAFHGGSRCRRPMISPSSRPGRDLEARGQARALRRRASGSGSPRTGSAGPRRRPGRRGGSATSCRGPAPGARTTTPPNTSPIAWWPRQTPRIGMRSAHATDHRASRCPASAGVPGPGDTTMPAGARRSISSTVIASFR